MSGAFKPQPTFFRPSGATEKIAVGASSQQSAAMPDGTAAVRLAWSGAAAGNLCHVEFDNNPTAVSGTSMPITDGLVEYLKISGGEKIAVIGDGATHGDLFITPVTK